MNGPPVHPRLLLFGLGNITRPRARNSVGHAIIHALVATKVTGRLKFRPQPQGHVFTSNVSIGGSQSSEGPVARVVLAKSGLARCHDGVTLKRLLSKPPWANLGLLLRQVVIIRESIEHAPFTVTHIPPTLKPNHAPFLKTHSHTRTMELLDPRSVHQLLVGIGRPPKGLEDQFLLGGLPRDLAKYWGASGTGVQKIWGFVEEILGNGLHSPITKVDSIELWQTLASEWPEHPKLDINDKDMAGILETDLGPFTHRSRQFWEAGLSSTSSLWPRERKAKPAKLSADYAVSSSLTTAAPPSSERARYLPTHES